MANFESAARMEEMAKMYHQLNEEQQEKILNMFNDEDRITFLKCMGVYKLITDRKFYNATQQYIGERLYAEFNAQ